MRPQDEYLDQASLDQLHRASRAWLSEIEFWKNEVQFLSNLASKDLMAFIAKEKISRATEVFAILKTWQKTELPSLKEMVALHERHLGVLLENPFNGDDTAFRLEHGKIEQKISAFMADFRKMKQEIFQVEEEIMLEEKTKNQLEA